MRVYQKHAGDDAKLLIKFHWPNKDLKLFTEFMLTTTAGKAFQLLINLLRIFF